MRVIGTAGHVDHGKSALVAALTGTHPDRLKEEQAREMTIDLGFAWMSLPDGETVGIVDVPGHRDFIENMLAGVGGIDAVLFVVAADEGVMPQTREHLAILDLLQVAGGVIVLTKIDLIEDAQWLDLVEADVLAAVAGTVLAEAPIVRVSARTGVGLEALQRVLAECLAERPARADLDRARLPIDRIFTMPGFGTVVTGTLLDGSLRVGQEIEVLPGGLRGRVRGLQTHRRKEDVAVPGSRTAVNISGINIEQVQRGNVLVQPNRYRPSQRLDVSFRLLADASGPVRHSSEVKFFIGAAEVLARVRLLGVEELLPGQEGWLQLELREGVVAVRGDRYILRRPSPGETLGGGVILDAQPTGRHKRFDEGILLALEALRQGTPEDILLQAAQTLGLAAMRDLAARTRLDGEQIKTAAEKLIQSGALVQIEPGALLPGSDLLVAAGSLWQRMTAAATQEAAGYHRSFPLRRGMPREELKSRLKLSARQFSAAVRRWIADGVLVENGPLLAAADHRVQFSASQQGAVERLLARFAQSRFSPPSVKECTGEVTEEVFTALVEQGRLVQVSGEVVFRSEDYAALLAGVQAHFGREATLTVVEFRDQYQTSRKYALAFLEHLDAINVTVRDGDVRRLRQRA